MKGRIGMEMDLNVKVRRSGKIPIIDLSGDVDSYTCSRLGEVIRDLIDEGEVRMVVSMVGVDYIDSSGLGTLVGGMKRATDHSGGLAITGASPQIQKVLSITGLVRVFDVYKDEAEAARSLSF